MINNNFDYLKFFNEPDIDNNLWESGFFCGDYNTNNGSLSKPLSNLGYELSDMLDGKYLGKIHPDDRTTYQTLIDRLHSGLDDILHSEYRLLDKNNNWNWILTQAFVIKRNNDNTVHKIIGIDRDINSQKIVENYYHDELIESKFRLNLFESLQKLENSQERIEEILKKLKHVVDYINCEIYTYQDDSFKKLYQYPFKGDSTHINIDSILNLIKENQNPVIIDDPLICNPNSSRLVIPLQINKNIIGIMILWHSLKGFYKGRDLIPIKGFSDFLSLHINTYLLKREESKIIEKIHKDEHLNIARELHDGISQNLACGKIITEQLINPKYKDTVDKNEILKLHNIIKNTLKEVRILTEGIRLTSETRDLNSLIEMYCRKLNNYFSINITFENNCTRYYHVTSQVSENLLRIIQEGVSNSQRHSKGNKVVVSLSCHHQHVTLQLKDNGEYPISFKEGLGMKGIRERTKILKGQVKWESDNGTVLTLKLPDEIFNGEKYENTTD